MQLSNDVARQIAQLMVQGAAAQQTAMMVLRDRQPPPPVMRLLLVPSCCQGLLDRHQVSLRCQCLEVRLLGRHQEHQ